MRKPKAGPQKPRTKADLEKALAVALESRDLIAVQMAGALLETVTDLIARGERNMPLHKVVALANQRAEAAAWRRAVHLAVNGPLPTGSEGT